MFRRVLRESASAYRRHLGTLLAASLLVLVPAGLSEAIAVARIDSATDDLGRFAEGLIIGLATVGIGSAGYQFVKGVATSVVGDARYGGERSGLLAVARELPWVRLLILDLIVTTIVSVGLELLIVPGALAATWFALSPVIVEREDIDVLAAMRRSRALVRGHFRLVLGLTAFGSLIYDGLKPAIAPLFHLLLPRISIAGAQLDEAFAYAVAGALLKPYAALLIVTLTFDLIEEEQRGALTRPTSL